MLAAIVAGVTLPFVAGCSTGSSAPEEATVNGSDDASAVGDVVSTQQVPPTTEPRRVVQVPSTIDGDRLRVDYSSLGEVPRSMGSTLTNADDGVIIGMFVSSFENAGGRFISFEGETDVAIAVPDGQNTAVELGVGIGGLAPGDYILCTSFGDDGELACTDFTI